MLKFIVYAFLCVTALRVIRRYFNYFFAFIFLQNREDDSLLRSLGFRNTTPSPSQSGDHIGLGGTAQIGQKRPGEDGDLNIAVKRPVDGSHQVSSSGTSSSNNVTSKLWEKNKMLASLLAKQPPQPTNIPPIPASVISATPQVQLISKL